MAGSYVSTTNPCRMCRPLGACLAFRGVENAIVLLHGSQGCSTYMRRYISSHFHEPVDIASSSLSEKNAVYGGEASLKQGIRNVIAKYAPAVLGVATTCLTETIGDDVPRIIASLLRKEPAVGDTAIIPVSTPSYSGSHVDGFNEACVAIVEKLAAPSEKTGAINLFPGFVSPADTRHLQEIMADFETPAVLLPDLSQTLDGGIDGSYSRLPPGGVSREAVAGMAGSAFSIEFNMTGPSGQSAARLLDDRYDVYGERLPLPIGIRNCDRFFQTLGDMALRPVPGKHRQERARLLDAMVDAHKYLFGRKAAIFGDADFALALTSFLADAGIVPVLVASGGGGDEFAALVRAAAAPAGTPPVILTQTDFDEIREQALQTGAELLVGSSKGNHIARELDIPLLRLGFPVHDRIGAQRILHIGYRGSMNLLDMLTNIVIAREQERLGGGYGYSYM